MPPIPSVWHWHSLVARHIKSLRTALEQVGKAVDTHLSSTSQAQLRTETILLHNAPKQPLHHLARIRQTQARWFSTAKRHGARNFSSAAGRRGGSAGFTAASIDKVTFAAQSHIGARISQSSARAPFASTLRPNLTGGTLNRTAGGYTLGAGSRAGGARHFSHVPASQAQVVHNVSQAVRAFFISGQKAQFDGFSPVRGEKRYKAMSAVQEETGRKMHSLPRSTPGSRLEFVVNPTITALTQLRSVVGYEGAAAEEHADHLNTAGLLDVLSVDFSRALKDLAAVLNDLKRLSGLGDLPITYEGSALRVHFPGCDAETVERLCDELGVLRGSVIQDEAFDSFVGTEIALLFPFAPSEGSLYSEEEGAESLYVPSPPARKLQHPSKHVISIDDMFTPSSPAYSTQSEYSGMEDILATAEAIVGEEKAWLSSSSSPSGYESVRSGSESAAPMSKHDPLEYQGFEGIYRFIEELDAVRK